MAADGSAWWAGWFAGTLPLTDQVLTSLSQDDSYLVRLSPEGFEELVISITGLGTQRTLDVAAAPDGGAVVVGQFSTELALTDTTYPAIGDSAAYVVRYDDAGVERWARVFGGVDPMGFSTARATSVAVGPDGGVFVVGSFDHELEVEGTVYPAAGLRDLFTVELDSNGNVLRVSTFGDETEQYPSAAGAFPDGSHVFAGAFDGTLTIGMGVDATSAGGTDAFVVRLLPP